jgi:hypothetical protein
MLLGEEAINLFRFNICRTCKLDYTALVAFSFNILYAKLFNYLTTSKNINVVSYKADLVLREHFHKRMIEPLWCLPPYTHINTTNTEGHD